MSEDIDDGFLGLGPAEEQKLPIEEAKVPTPGPKKALGRARVKRQVLEKERDMERHMVKEFHGELITHAKYREENQVQGAEVSNLYDIALDDGEI